MFSFTQQNGVLVLNKPSGCTSNFCLQRIKHELSQPKIGHAGTLDPMVDGVLLVLLGYGTKIAQYLLEGGKKTYKGTLALGYETDTWDKEGTILQKYSYSHITEEEVIKAIGDWKNITIQQVPPVSAAKFQGKPLYKWARMGHTIETKHKQIEIESVSVLSVDLPYVTFRVTCSSGTYIRSLAHSLGKCLQSAAVLTDLTREASYPFSLEDSVPLDTLLQDPMLLQSTVKNLVSALPAWHCIHVNATEAKAVQNGRPVFTEMPYAQGEKAILSFREREIALAEFCSTLQGWKILRGL